MAIHDPISDFLTSVRNAAKARHLAVEFKGSKLLLRIAELLRDEGYLANVKVVKERPQKVIKATIKYDATQKPVFRSLKRVSMPSRRVYVKSADVRRVLGGMGISIISTSHGLMTDRQARKSRLGGEVICEVW